MLRDGGPSPPSFDHDVAQAYCVCVCASERVCVRVCVRACLRERGERERGKEGGKERGYAHMVCGHLG